jgi:hypothetical protein
MMGTAVSLFYLRETNHLLATLTRNAAESGELDEAALQRVLPNGLVLRDIPQTGMTNASAPDDRANVGFEVDLRHIAVAATEIRRVDDAVFLSRPTKFSIVDGKAEETPPAMDGIERVVIKILSTGVKVTIEPNPVTTIAEEIPVWCLVLTNKNDTLVQSAVIPKNPNPSAPSSITVPFSLIPAGAKHTFLIMIRGFQPIWDELQVGDPDRTWTSTP